MTTVRKILYSFFLSAFLFAGIVIVTASGIVILVAVFLTLFLIIFFCFNLRQDSPYHAPESAFHKHDEELEELEAVDAPELKSMFAGPSRISNIRIAFGNDDIPYLVESSGLELVDGDIDEVIHFMEDAALAESAPPEELKAVSPLSSMLSLLGNDIEKAAELEDISDGPNGSLFMPPFVFSLGNPELLQSVGNEVVYEQNGIHYISEDVLNNDKGMEKESNNNFAKLVESVVNKHGDF